jgi:hypothetical protein
VEVSGSRSFSLGGGELGYHDVLVDYSCLGQEMIPAVFHNMDQNLKVCSCGSVKTRISHLMPDYLKLD